MAKGRPTPKAPQNRPPRDLPLEPTEPPRSPRTERAVVWLGWLHDLLPFRKPFDAATRSFRLARLKVWIPTLPPGVTLLLVAAVVALSLDHGSGGGLAAAVLLYNPTARAAFSLIGWYPVRLYGAAGDGAADDQPECQSAIAASSTAGGGLVYFSRGTFKCVAGLTVPTGAQITLEGAGLPQNGSPPATTIWFSADLGATNYAIKPADATTPAGCALRGLRVLGLNTGAAFGTTPANMYGVDLFVNWDLYQCKVEGFKAGVVLRGDHNLVFDSYLTNNFYNVYFGPSPVTQSDHRFISVEAESPKFASFAVASDNTIDGALFMTVHTGGGPFGFWKEGAPASNATFVANSTFIDISCEGFGNAIMSTERGQVSDGGNIFGNRFVECSAGASFTGAARITGFDSVSDRAFICGDLKNNCFEGGSWHTSQAAHGTNGWLKVFNFNTNFLDYAGSSGSVPTNWGTIGAGINNYYRSLAPATSTPSVASAQAVTLPPVHQGTVVVTGTTTIESINAWHPDAQLRLRFTGTLTVSDAVNNLKMAGNFAATPDDVLELVCDGTNWWEVGRSNN